MTKIRTSSVLVIGYWSLGFICNLVLGIWDFMSGPSDVGCFSLNSPCLYCIAKIFQKQ